MPWMTMPIAMGIAAIGGAGTTAYQIKSANTTNKRSMEASERSEATAASIERERLAEERRALDAQLSDAKAARETAVQRDRERWQDYLRINEPMWRAGSGILGSLYDIAGMGGNAPTYAEPSMPAPGTGAQVLGPGPAGPGSGALSLSGMMTGGTAGGPLPTPKPRPVAYGRRPARPPMATPGGGGLDLSTMMQLAAMSGGGDPAAVRRPAPYYGGNVA